jgi:hypothetical protein
MQLISRTLILATLVGITSIARAQSSQASFPPAPTTKAAVGQWDVAIVQRAATILSSPAQWNRNDTDGCAADAKTFSIVCALNRAVEEAAGIYRDRSGASISTEQSQAPFSDCRLHPASDGREGSCGTLFDEVPVFTISRVKAITSGTWRTDVHPIEVWAGIMSDAEGPVMDEARKLVDVVTTRKYPGRLVGYNNDSSTTFTDVQNFFRLLQGRVLERGTADLSQSFDSLEIEVYAGGTGVIRTYNGWFTISGFDANDSALRFQIATAKEVPPSALDREILERAAQIINSDAVWNRADNRKCPAAATTWSIYCAVEKAEFELTGGFHHRRPAGELVREIVDERVKDRNYNHRMMDYNNDPATHLEDVRTLFAEAIARIK